MKITYKNWTFRFAQIESAKPTQEQSLNCESVSADTLTAVVRCNDPAIMAFAKNDPIRFWASESNTSMQTYYLKSVTRTGETSYRLVAWSAVGLLTAMAHKGGIYTGQTVKEVVKDICGSVPVAVKSAFANTKLYGWLPYCQPNGNGKGSSARDNLAQVLLAIGAYLMADLNGVLHVDSLWDDASSAIKSSRMYVSGGSVKYGEPISAVVVTEHQYVPGTEEKELFSGTSQQDNIIIFSEPMHSLSANGFTILESGANYAKLSSGSGSLSGKSYIHNTRLVTKTVTENATENVKSFPNATLISLVNSAAVAKRLADYYKCRETITNGILSGPEKPGHVVSVYHPYDKKMVSACVASLDTTISKTIKSEMSALVGFTPSRPEAAEELDTVEILTESGSWTVPEGVTKVHAVLIGGGAGGQAGYAGESSAQQVVQNYNDQTSYVKYSQKTVFWVQGGPGGAAGAPGAGGKILESEVSVTPGQSISFSIGAGGEGGAYSEGSSTQPAGSDGTDTTFGDLTTADGSQNETGYMDPVSGNVYGSLGAAGIPGSQGHGRVKDDSGAYVDVDSPTITVDGVTYTQGASGGNKSVENGENTTNPKGRCYAGYGFSGGGGPAYGANGFPGGEGSCATNYSSSVPNVFSRPGRGGDGATALPPPDETIYGKGGRGGNGGGGAGTPSYATVGQNIPVSGTTVTATLTINIGAYTLGSGGNGSNGGKGAPGAVLLYYRSPKIIKSGPVVTKAPSKWLNDRLGRRFVV